MRKIGSGSMIAALCVFLLVAAPPVGLGQELGPEELNKKIIELYDAGQYAEAIPLAQRVLSMRGRRLERLGIELI
jgi:hypothetical protein